MLTLPYDSAIVHVVAEFGVYRKNGKQEKVVLLVRETNDTWGTVGGGREEEDNNDCTRTALREFREEMGVNPMESLEAPYTWEYIDDNVEGMCFKWVLSVQAWAEDIERWWGLPQANYDEKMSIIPPNCKEPPEIIGYAWIALSDLQKAHFDKSESVMITPNGFPYNRDGIEIQLRGRFVTSPTVKYSNPYTVHTF